MAPEKDVDSKLGRQEANKEVLIMVDEKRELLNRITRPKKRWIWRHYSW